MAESTYRIVMTYDKTRAVYSARIPELDPCFAEGKTRQEALLALETELSDRLYNMKEKGMDPPIPLDEQEFPESISLPLSVTLRKELVWQAMNEGISVESLISELILSAIGKRGQDSSRLKYQSGQPQSSPKRPDGEHRRHRPYPNQGDHRNRPHQGRSPGAYNELLNDRANFIQYVRDSEGPSQGESGHRNEKHRYDAGHKKRHPKKPNRPKGRAPGEQPVVGASDKKTEPAPSHTQEPIKPNNQSES